ncbi:MAG TPA: twin-arginine translocase TatA/TatE family subunit [Candidatus Angelobacter sp.]|jgi:sec-independent protein translocase protein TatA|nr:twin-arginine translocase TatA/TatE family subunit [Candidatus Angelobacter sp.]
MFGGKLGLPELLILFAIALLFFGPGKLADFGKGLGEGIKNFKGALKDGSGSTSGSPEQPAPPAAPAEKK